MKSFNLFDYKNPVKALQDYLHLQPKRGRGLIQKLAEQLRISQPQMSQLFRGTKVFTVENAIAIASYFKWSKEEVKYWVALVERERAGDVATKTYFESQMQEAKSKALSVVESFGPHHELDDKDKAEFYSTWIYSAIRLFCSLGIGKSRQELLQIFSHLNRDEIEKVISFLIRTGLIQKENDLYVLGQSKTFVKRGSPFLKSHLTNWRLKAVDQANAITEDEIIFSAPLSISKKGLSLLRKELQSQISNLSSNLESYGDAEEVVCLNIDLYRLISNTQS